MYFRKRGVLKNNIEKIISIIKNIQNRKFSKIQILRLEGSKDFISFLLLYNRASMTPPRKIFMTEKIRIFPISV